MITASAPSPNANRSQAPSADSRRGCVGIVRQQQTRCPARRIRGIDAGIGADEPVRGLRDDQRRCPCARCVWLRAARPRSCADPCPTLAKSAASGDGSTVRRSTTRPSALETILWVTTRMSPAFQTGTGCARWRRRSGPARSSPGSTSGRPARPTMPIRPGVGGALCRSAGNRHRLGPRGCRCSAMSPRRVRSPRREGRAGGRPGCRGRGRCRRRRRSRRRDRGGAPRRRVWRSCPDRSGR